MNHTKQIMTWFDNNELNLISTANFIFDHPELPNEEHVSSQYLSNYLHMHGFFIEYNIAGLETAFIATWGQGSPVLGFLAEYDALSGMAQKPATTYCPMDGPGHGCGHNLLGTAVIAAACALKSEMESTGQAGTICVFGCPAEEIMSGKIIMNKAGVFNAIDVAITWHPFDRNRISNDIWLAQDIKNYTFHGRASHAARFPELGRSALDAAELMNVGVNYLREHVPSDVRMHYAYLDVKAPANIVPDYVKTNYFIRSGLRSRTEDASLRIDDCAKGAALMTGTSVEIDLIASCQEMKVNRPLMEVFYDAMTQVPVPTYTKEELAFAKALCEEAGITNDGCLFGSLEPLEPQPSVLSIGTDVSDVSHTVPTVTISAATMCKGTPLHHWSTTAQSGMSIGHKGMLYAAKCMAIGSQLLLDHPEYLANAWKEHSV